MAHMESPGRKRRLGKLALKLFGATLVGFVCVEVGLRYALFGDGDLAHRLGRSLRKPGLFAHRGQDDYWKLRYTFRAPEHRQMPPEHDPAVGWVNPWVAPRTYEHEGRAALGGRRPVLLYGDSFAECATSRADCWEGLLERSDLGGELALLNYGTGGFALDQIFLLFLHSVDLYEDPIVVFSLLVDDDIDRCGLSFRAWPKPRFSLAEDGGLELGDPVIEGSDAFLEAHPVSIDSYLFAYLTNGSTLLPATWRNRLTGRGDFTHVKRLGSGIFEALAVEIERRGLDFFVLLFHGKAVLDEKRSPDWRDRFVRGELERIGIPYVSSRYRLVEDTLRTRNGVAEYFVLSGRGRNHLTPLGNRIVFGALRSGLRAEYDGG